jgi:hypothetical protein
MGLRLFACWDCGFESRRGHGCLCCVYCIKTVAWNVGDNEEGRKKGFKGTNWIHGKKTGQRKKRERKRRPVTVSQRRGPASIPRQSVLDLCCTQWHCDSFFSKYLGFPMYIFKYHESSVQCEPSFSMRTDMNLTVAFCSIANAPKEVWLMVVPLKCFIFRAGNEGVHPCYRTYQPLNDENQPEL